MSKNRPAANKFLALVELARLRIVVMVVVTGAIGYVLANQSDFQPLRLFFTLIGTALLSSGSCALNCYIEREQDALMPRTCNRPIPAGIITPNGALVYGLILCVLGALLLFATVNSLSAVLGLIAAFVYLILYTPAKRLTWLNTTIGAVPGAIPPMIGWASARGQLDPGAWILFAMLLIWQHTHFFPIAWLYKSDYNAGGFRMLPCIEDANGKQTYRLTVYTAIALIPISMLLCGQNVTGVAYICGALFFGALLLAASVLWWKQPSREGARNVLLISLLYIPALFVAVVYDRYGGQVGYVMHGWIEAMLRWS